LLKELMWWPGPRSLYLLSVFSFSSGVHRKR